MRRETPLPTTLQGSLAGMEGGSMGEEAEGWWSGRAAVRKCESPGHVLTWVEMIWKKERPGVQKIKG